jgi:2-dehydro-3-deoxy-L-rhamnonate dehydrogenase (NAD+)
MRLAGAGAAVVVCDLDRASAQNVVSAVQEKGGQALALEMEVSDPASVQRAFDQALAWRGQLDVVVNNAGVAGRAAPIWEQTDEDWNKTIAINLTGVFNCCRAALPSMLERNYGRVVNIASLAGKEGNPNMTAYSAAKAGVIALSKSLAKETATKNICVNAVSPTVIRTPILDQLTPEQVDYMTSRIPRGRTGTVEEVAAVVHFLSSPDCSFVTGQCYDVSGGRATY